VQISTVSQDRESNVAVLQVERQRRLPYPVMRYLPGPTGELLSIDFEGCALSCPPSNLKFPHAAITHLQIAQWQAYPPVVRLTFEARDTDAYKRVALESTRGRLIVRLPAQHHHSDAPAYEPPISVHAAAPAAELPPLAPPFAAGNQVQPISVSPILSLSPNPMPAPAAASASAANMPALRGPIAQSAPDDATYCVLPPQKQNPENPSKLSTKAVRHPLADSEAPAVAALPDGTSNATRHGGVKQALKKLFAGRPATEKSDGEQNAEQNDATTSRQIAFSTLNDGTLHLDLVVPSGTTTFRLHEPERYVIDMPELDKHSLRAAAVPNNCAGVKSLRIGSPEGSAGTARVVVDLSSPDLAVSESLDNEKHTLSLTFGTPSKPAPSNPASPDSQHVPVDAVVLLDAGHGGSDPGAQRGDVQEKEITLAIVERLKHLLETQNIHVKLTRADDSFVSLEDRVRVTNEVKPNVFLSVHINALETNTQATGIETYYQTDLSRDLAQLIHGRLVKELAVPDRSIRKARFYVINHTPYPAVLAEVGFISNKEERDKLSSGDYQLQVARALSDGVVSYLSQRPASAGMTKAAAADGTIAERKPSSAPAACSPAQSVAQSFTQNLQTQRAWLPAGESRKP
jgi:N-acetylmuramoyl-L-alanine amidase